MSTPVGHDAAAEARALGNELYRAGKLVQAEKAYKKAASLAPQDPSPISNLSAVRYEMGDYRGAIDHIRFALSLNFTEPDDSAKKDKLYNRLAKCFLHLLDFKSAEDAMSSIGNSQLRVERIESVESTKALWVEVPDESMLRRQVLDQVPRYKPSLQDVPEYYSVGHDSIDPVTEPLGKTDARRREISFFFAGSGDGRNLFSAIGTMAGRAAQMRKPSPTKFHFTVLDLKPAALARLLIIFSMMVRVDIREDLHTQNDCLAMAYLFSCQFIPPFVEDKLQSTIKELIKKLENGDAVLEFIHVREQDREPIVRVLRQWQQPYGAILSIAHIRTPIKRVIGLDGMSTVMHFGKGMEYGTQEEKKDFDKFTALLPPTTVANRREPQLAGLLTEYRSTGKSKKLLRYIDSNWKFNNTLIDYDFAERGREKGDDCSQTVGFHPLKVIEGMGLGPAPKEADKSSIERLAEVFSIFSLSVMSLRRSKRLFVEVIVGEMADIMERIRYNLLDYRQSSPKDGGTINATTFPRAFDYVHMSNIPDYIGGHLTTFLVCRPLLKEDQPSSLRFSNLLNPPEFEDHQAFQSEYLLMYDTERIRQHFHLERRPGEVPNAGMLPPMIGGFEAPFLLEGDIIWDRVSGSAMSFQRLLPKPEFEKWMYGHLLKICMPHPRPIVSGQPVHAPLNLATLIRLMIGMFEVGYPAHWLLGSFSCICTGVITTSARPPTKRVSTPSDVDAKRPAKKISVQPWVAEFTTLLSIWRRILPFGMDSLGGSLVSLETIHQYSITFPPFVAEYDHVPHFILVFWNTVVGYTINPPQSIYDILIEDGRGDGNVSSRDVREKGIICVNSLNYATASRTAAFWMRADKMEEMMAGKWRAFIWRTDSWNMVSEGVDVSSGVAKGKGWRMLS